MSAPSSFRTFTDTRTSALLHLLFQHAPRRSPRSRRTPAWPWPTGHTRSPPTAASSAAAALATWSRRLVSLPFCFLLYSSAAVERCSLQLVLRAGAAGGLDVLQHAVQQQQHDARQLHPPDDQRRLQRHLLHLRRIRQRDHPRHVSIIDPTQIHLVFVI